jgi:hypothetical protein
MFEIFHILNLKVICKQHTEFDLYNSKSRIHTVSCLRLPPCARKQLPVQAHSHSREKCLSGLVHTFRFSTGRELTGRMRAQLGTSFTPSGFLPAGRYRLSPDKVVEHRKAQAYSHNPVVWPDGKKKPECVNVSISNTYTTDNSATGRRPCIVVDSSVCYPAAGRQIPGRPGRMNTSMLSCVPLLCPAIIDTCRPVENRNVFF